MPAWFIWSLAALLSWGVWAVLSKALGDSLTGEQSQALSTLGLLPILLPLALKSRVALRAASGRGVALAFVGGAIGCLGNIVYYAALARGEKAATVVSITAMSPLVTVLLAVVLLRERINRMQFCGLALSFVAIWLFNVQNERGLLSSTLWFAVPPILLWGLSGFLQKVATNHLTGEVAALAYLGSFIPVGLFLAWHSPWPESIPTRAWVVVLALGFFLAFGNVAILCALARHGKAAVISPLCNLYPIISVPVAVCWFHERIGAREWIAIATALLSVVALSWETPAAANSEIARQPAEEAKQF